MHNLEQTIWETPVNSFRDPWLASITHDFEDLEGLEIIIKDPDTNARVKFFFEGFINYRSTNELYLNYIWPGDLEPIAKTVTLKNSSYMTQFSSPEYGIDFMLQNAKHYHIITNDDWIDIISNAPPTITLLTPV